MPNKASNGWVRDPANPNRYTYTDSDGSVYESVSAPEKPVEDVSAPIDTPQADPYGEAVAQPPEAPEAVPQATQKATGWVADPSTPGRYTYTDSDGSVYESAPKAAPKGTGVPMANGPELTPEQRQATVKTPFQEAIDNVGGFGISDETRSKLGGQYSPLSTVADLGARGLQGLQVVSEVAAHGLDDAFDQSGLADALSVGGNKFHPGTAAMALMEAFPDGGLIHGVNPEAVATGMMERIKNGANRADIDKYLAENGLDKAGPDLEKVLEARDAGRPFDVTPTYRTQTQEKAVKAATKAVGPDATPEALADAVKAAGQDPAILDKQPFTSMKQRAENAKTQRVNDIQDRVDTITKDWSNKPDFEVVHSVDDIADPEIKQAAIDQGAKGNEDYEGAKGFLGPDGKVRLVSENIQSPDELHAVVFHEALGHYGLAQKFGDELDATLNNFYEHGSGDFRQKVDDWMAKNPDYYKGQQNPQLLASEEVLAEMSERGAIPAPLKDRVTNLIKDTGRSMGLDLRYSDREINTVLGMSHDAVINGLGRDVAANGFRMARAYHGSKNDFDEFSNDFEGSGSGAQLAGHGTYVSEDPEYAAMYKGKAGRLYHVDIPDTGWLHWDKPLHEQPDALAAFEKAGFEPEPNRTAGQNYQNAAFEHGPKAVSDSLYEQGMRGNRYEDYDGTVNHVVYNPRDVSIVQKFMQRRRRSGDDLDEPTGAMMSGNINLDRIQTSRDVSSILDDLAKAAPREVKSFDDIKSEARDLNLNPTKVMKDVKGVGNLSAKIHAYRQVQTDVLERTAELYQRLEDNYNEVDHANYLQKMTQLNAIYARVSNDTGEIGRALSAMRMLTQSSKRSSEILEALKASGLPMSALHDKDVFMRFAKQVHALNGQGNPTGAATLMNKVVKPYWEDYILSGRHAMMLSGLGTHYKNFRDNLNIIAREYIESGLATGWAGVAKEEMAARTYGLMRAFLDVNTYKDTVQAFRDGMQNSKIGTKMELEQARVPILSKVGDALNASDVFFRHFIETTNLYANGVREAQKQGFTGKNLFAQGSHLALNPTEEMLELSRKQADVALLVSEPTKLAKGIESIKARQLEMNAGQRTGRFIAHLVFPFLRTTENLIYQQLRRSPLSFMDRTTREDFAAGGARRGTAITRTALGSAIMGYYIWAAKNNLVTGQEKDLKKQAALEPGGYKQNATVDDKGYTDASALNLSFPNPFGLDNATAANVATLVNTYHGLVKTGSTAAEAFGSSVKAFLNIMSNASFAQNITPWVDAFNEPSGSSGKIGNAVGGLASQFTPALARQINNAEIDTKKRDYSGDRGFRDRVVGRIESGIPGLSDNFPLRYDVYGQPVEKGANISGVGARSLKPTDPVVKEMQRVEGTIDKPVITAAPRNLTVDGMKASLTGETYANYQKAVGTHLREVMSEVVKTDGWKSLDDKSKREVMRQAQKEARTAAKADIVPTMKLTDFKDPKDAQ